MKAVSINKLELKLNSISASETKSIISGIDNELITQLSNQQKLINASGRITIDFISPIHIKKSDHYNAADVRKLICSKIIREILNNI